MPDHPSRIELARRYEAVRRHTLALAEPLSTEDQAAQSMPDASPAKWHQAHTSWFFEALLLRPHLPGYQPLDEQYHQLFNSYYEALGPRHPRPQRGLLTRPSLDEVRAYRRHVDRCMLALVEQCPVPQWPAVAATLELGLNHEQQHQELMVTDALHLLSCHPGHPAMLAGAPQAAEPGQAEWLDHPGGLVELGAAPPGPGSGFAFDNEGPRHRAWLEPFQIASRLVTCGDYLRFIQAGGYREPRWWLSEGWATVQAQGWQAPLYWREGPGENGSEEDHWQVFGLHGLQPLDPQAPVMNLSFFEAAAYADWAGARLPEEAEWEVAATQLPGMAQLWDQAWQWTGSAYRPYPGFHPLPGPASEYNGKFMVGQQVLRGGSLATPAGHSRPSYRNFFPPSARWQFMGMRLARDSQEARTAQARRKEDR